MLRKEQNDLLTQTGPGTPMGTMFRRSWQPVLLASELPENECPPVRVKILSERLLAWRDTQGRYALTDEFCAHRGVSLWFGRNEENGLRCPYHGWKYDHTGQCIDVPSEPEESGFCKKIKLKSYPVIELGGVLWAYLGAPELQPPPPAWEFVRVPAEPEASRLEAPAEFELAVQALMEGGIDSSHVSFLHSGELDKDPLFKGSKGNAYNMGDMKPVFEVVESPGGLYIGARRNAENGSYYWRVTQWVMPAFTMIPPRADHPVHGHFWVPIDDENCWAWSFDYKVTRPFKEYELQAMKDGKGIHNTYVPGTFRPAANKDNDYLMDRAAQKSGRYYLQAACLASRCRTPRCRKAWGRSSIAPRRTWSRPTTASSWRGIVWCAHSKRWRRAPNRPASRSSISACARPRSCCRRTSTSRTTPRRRWWCRAATST